MNLYFVVVALATLFGIVMFVIVMNFGLLWLRAMASGASVSFASLIGMKLRRVNANAIVNARIMGVKAGLKLDVDKLVDELAKGKKLASILRG